MIKLFKAKSLKKTQKTEQGTGVQGADNKNAKKQRGRSMVEMLGVLAIIGVLSIGGIQGYTMAMRKYRANEILNTINKYALVVYTSCQRAIETGVQFSSYSEDYVSMINQTNNYWRCPVISFSDAGFKSDDFTIGFNGGTWSGMCAEDYAVEMQGVCGSGVSIVSRSSGDVVVVDMTLKDKALCETLLGIVGEMQTDNSAEYSQEWYNAHSLKNIAKCQETYNKKGYNFLISTVIN